MLINIQEYLCHYNISLDLVNYDINLVVANWLCVKTDTADQIDGNNQLSK